MKCFLLIALIIAFCLIGGCTLLCKPNWQCTQWTTCNIAGVQTRQCTDLNSCGSTTDKPPESQSCTPQTAAQARNPIVGYPFTINGQGYTSDPHVPLITQSDVNLKKLGTIGVIYSYTDYTDFYNQWQYRCQALKNEGTQAFTTAQAAASGTSSEGQMLNYYRVALDAVGREENCQQAINVASSVKLSLSESLTVNVNQLNSVLQQNFQVSQSDENIEITQYNSAANIFNNAILSCNNQNRVIGTDGMCHDICSGFNQYCPSDSTCVSGECLACLPGFKLTGNNNCIQSL